MIMKNYIFIFAFVVLFCGASDNLERKNQEQTTTAMNARATSVFVSDNDVYITGYQLNDNDEKVNALWKLFVDQNNISKDNIQKYNEFYSNNREIVAKLWKNGIAQDLSDGDKQNFALSVFVSGNDVYVAGCENTGNQGYKVANNLYITTHIAKLWKNGIAQNLCNNKSLFSTASSVFVLNKDVYVAGYEVLQSKKNQDTFNRVARLWKNEKKQNLSHENGYANSVFVSGNNVYLAGCGEYFNSSTGEIIYYAALWINGLKHNLTSENKRSAAHSVFVSGDDVFVAGIEYVPPDFSRKKPVLWKNGIAQYLNCDSICNLMSDFVDGTANSVKVTEDGNVYVTGFVCNSDRKHAVLWKNGVLEQIFDDKGVFLNGTNIIESYNSLFISEKDVYVPGNNDFCAVFWKNGAMHTLSEKPTVFSSYHLHSILMETIIKKNNKQPANSLQK